MYIHHNHFHCGAMLMVRIMGFLFQLVPLTHLVRFQNCVWYYIFDQVSRRFYTYFFPSFLCLFSFTSIFCSLHRTCIWVWERICISSLAYHVAKFHRIPFCNSSDNNVEPGQLAHLYCLFKHTISSHEDRDEEEQKKRMALHENCVNLSIPLQTAAAKITGIWFRAGWAEKNQIIQF